MQKHNMNQLIEFNERKFVPQVLLNEPGCRVVLLSMRAGQSIPEHTVQAIITVYAILGQVSFYAGSRPCDLYAGEFVRIESGLPHRVEARRIQRSWFLLRTVTVFRRRLRRTRPARHPASERPSQHHEGIRNKRLTAPWRPQWSRH